MSISRTDRSKKVPINAHLPWGEEFALAQRQWLVAAAVAMVVFTLAALTTFLWREHRLALGKAEERAVHLSRDLAEDLEQTLKVARTAITAAEAQLGTAPQHLNTAPGLPIREGDSNVLASLPLPFFLHPVGANGSAIVFAETLPQFPNSGQAHRHPSRVQLTAQRWALTPPDPLAKDATVPLVWKAAMNAHGVEGYAVDLSLAALNDWLERKRHGSDDSASLFWMNGNGTATLLARAPLASAQLGQQERAPWVDRATESATGVIDQYSAASAIPRQAAFHRLSGPASNLVVVYGAGTMDALSDWHDKLPYFVGLALALSAAVGYGAWRLHRSLQALTHNQMKFQLMLNSGNVWDWDIAHKTVRYSPAFFKPMDMGEAPPESRQSALLKMVHPDDAEKLRSALVSHLVERKPYALRFRLLNRKGETRWFDTTGQAFWDAAGRPQYMAGTAFDVTEQVALEDIQGQTLERLDMVTNAAPVLFWTSDLKGQATWFNRRWLAFTGRTTDQEIGQGWLEGIHPDDLEKQKVLYAQALSRQEPGSAELRLRDKDGHFRWVVVQCLPMRNANQTVTGLIGTGVDITDVKQAQGAARERGAMLEAVFHVLQDLLFVIDANGRCIHFQGSADKQLYVPSELFLGKLLEDIIPEPIAVLLHEKLALAKDGQLQEFAYQLTLPDGEHHFDARMALLPDSGHYMVVARDITERDQLRQQTERMQRFMTLQARLATNFINLPIAEIGQGIDHALAEIGQFAKTDRAYIFEYDFAQQQTSNTHEWCAPGVQSEQHNLQKIDLVLVPGWVQAHLANQMVAISDIQAMPAGPLKDILSAQGICSLITLPMNNAEGCIGFVGFDSINTLHHFDEEQVNLLRLFAQMLVNVYARMATEARLQSLTNELENRVQERTAQLDASVRRLSHANQELESFAYSVSHDLKSPLRSVEGFASLLLEDHRDSISPEGRNYLTRIQAASMHMARLINDLLNYCRMEELDKAIEPMEVLGVANDVITGMRNELESHGVQVRMQVAAGLKAMANPQGMAMVLRNLIDNAIKFARPGIPPEITLTAGHVDGHLRLCISDNGQGFDMRNHDRIFALFQRLNHPGAVSGTGIGLAMVHKAVQRMNGRIWADSKPGEGAKFHIELPLA